MSRILDLLEKERDREKFPDFKPGDKICVHVRIAEGEKTRIQPFEGNCIAFRRAGNRSTITVRKVSYGVGVERIFPLYSPLLEKIELVQRGQVRRAKMYYLRELEGKAGRIKEEIQV
jgi:large subunit ribosomal protein L19